MTSDTQSLYEAAAHASDDTDEEEATLKTEPAVAEAQQAELSQETVFEGLFVPGPWNRRAPILAASLPLIVVIFQTVIIPKTIWLSSFGEPLPQADRILYTVGMAILAGIISSFASGQIRMLWLWSVQERLQLQRSKGAAVHKTQVLLQIANLKRQARFYRISFTFLVVAALTSAIIGSTTITPADRSYKQPQFLYVGFNDPQNGWNGSSCWYEAPNRSDSSIAWKTGRGTYIVPKEIQSSSACANSIYEKMQFINQAFGVEFDGYKPDVYGSCLNTIGGSLSCKAIGSPVSLKPEWSQMSPFGYSISHDSKACLPLFARNPVSCRPGAHVQKEGGKVTGIDSDACSVRRNDTTHRLRLTQNDSQVVGLCTDGLAVGDVSFAVGTTDPASLNVMSSIMDDQKDPNKTDSYEVQCSMSLNNTMDFFHVFNSSKYGDDSSDEVSSDNSLSLNSHTCRSELGSDRLDGFYYEAIYPGDVEMMTVDQVLTAETRIFAATILGHVLDKTLLDLMNNSDVADWISIDPSEPVYGPSWEFPGSLAFHSSVNPFEDKLGVL